MLPFKDEIVKIEGWLTFAEGNVLYELAKTSLGGMSVVEVGSWKGRSTVCLGLGAKEGNRATVYAVDPHTGSSEHIKLFGEVDTYHVFLENLNRFGLAESVVPMKMTSEVASKKVSGPVSLLFIDGAHEYRLVKQDFQLWFDKVFDGGHIIFHDSWLTLGPNLASALVLLFSGKICNPRLVDSMTIIKKVNKATVLQRIFNVLFVIYRTVFGSKFLLRARIESMNTDPSYYNKL